MRLGLWRCRASCPVFLVLVALLGVSGCKSTASISGKVKYRNEPLKGGQVWFVNGEGQTVGSSRIDKDGSYSMDKVPVEKVTICVETESLKRRGNMNKRKYDAPQGQAMPSEVKQVDPEELAARYKEIPQKYADAKTSGKTYQVESGKQEKDIDLD